MLEVGNINVNGRMHYEWNRAHFGAWSVISSPLILGMDVTQTECVAAVIDVIDHQQACHCREPSMARPPRRSGLVKGRFTALDSRRALSSSAAV
jgi:alpha-galactosidase